MPDRTYATWIPRYLDSIHAKNYSEQTIKVYKNTLEHYARYKAYRAEHRGDIPKNTKDYADYGFDAEIDTTAAEIIDFATILSANGISSSTIRRYEAVLASFYRYLIRQDALEANPMDKVDRPKIKNQELKYLRHEDVMKLIESIEKPRDALLVRTIYATGMRVSEIRSMKVEDIDFVEETIRVHGKGGKIRTVFCDADTLTQIKDYLRGRYTGYVFEGRTASGQLGAWTVQHIIKLHAPDGITPHKIRHSYASELYRRSHDIRAVQENLGHASIKTTEIYVHTDLEERRRAYKQYFPLVTDTEPPKSVSEAP